MSVAAVIPIRSFDGLSRLAPVLDQAERAALMRRLAERTTGAAAEAGAEVTVVTGGGSVADWALECGFARVPEPRPGGLNAAAAAAIAAVQERWMVIHADLPAIAAADVFAALKAVERGRRVLAPSHDGGTSLIGGAGPAFPFAYGVGSFRRHLSLVPDAAVIVRRGLALDLDHTRDLVALRTLASL